MARNMFGGGEGSWGEEPWEGWWGDDPPFRKPVFVLTHHEQIHLVPTLLGGGTRLLDGLDPGTDLQLTRVVD